MQEWISFFSIMIIPLLILFILGWGLLKKVSIYDTFVKGGKEGFVISLQLIPHLVGMIVAVSVFRASGALELFTQFCKPLLVMLSIPPDIFPLLLLRPISGSASLAYTADLIENQGPDSIVGRIASVIQGSTDTTLYVLTVYFGAIGIRKTLYALKLGLIADAFGFMMAILVVYMLF
jgi:spore maturation protein B